jgi:predicted kinase
MKLEGNMSKLTVLVGIPASGKSTYASEVEDAIVLSSDQLRIELYGDVDNQDNNGELFQELNRRAKEALNNGQNVILDATNINAKRRIHLVQQEFRDYPNKVARVYLTPYELCLKRNSERERKVPNHVIKRMYLNFQIPTYEEGWSDIEFRLCSTDGERNYLYHMREEFEKLILDNSQQYDMLRQLSDGIKPISNILDLPQDSKYHAFSVSRHTYHVWEYLINHETVKSMNREDQLAILWTSIFHDTGKYETKTFTDSKGEPSRYAHFYNHENVSAQHALKQLFLMGYPQEFALRVAKYCLWHMKLLNVDAEWGSKSAKKFLNFVGEDTFNILQLFREADTQAK